MSKPPSSRRWLRSTRLQDAALALAVIVPEAFFFGDPVAPGATTSGRLELLAFCLPELLALMYRRRRPVAAFAVVWAAAVGANLLTATTDFQFTPYFGMLVALYTAARQSTRAAAFAALALALVPAALAVRYTVEQLAAPGYHTAALIAGIAFYLPVTAATWGIGVWSRAVAEAAARDRRELARARRAVVHERTRIARELHDIVANAVAVMVMQAEAARADARPAPGARPAAADASLARIEEVGRAAMAELRRLLRLLRTAEASFDTDGTEPDTARHGLADLATLLEDVRRAGVLVELEVSGTPAHLDDSLDVTAYRLVQEAVTNVTKHAGPGSRAVVRIGWSEVLHLEVVDDGAGRSGLAAARGLSTGHGLLGLAERVALFGGELSAAPYRNGFRVTATLPLTPVSPSAIEPGESP
ncbi:sensor histidine kinase [Kitasatospora sp. NPDC101183]|uniref:sensor histidine kinase n=1 Tax=Kitasatospora sp. NPDC101183 TaxID=3364100 RepID=UPI0037F11CDC